MFGADRCTGLYLDSAQLSRAWLCSHAAVTSVTRKEMPIQRGATCGATVESVGYMRQFHFLHSRVPSHAMIDYPATFLLACLRSADSGRLLIGLCTSTLILRVSWPPQKSRDSPWMCTLLWQTCLAPVIVPDWDGDVQPLSLWSAVMGETVRVSTLSDEMLTAWN